MLTLEEELVVERWAVVKTSDYRVMGLTKCGAKLLLAVGTNAKVARRHAWRHRKELEQDGVEFDYQWLEVWDVDKWRPQ